MEADRSSAIDMSGMAPNVLEVGVLFLKSNGGF
jgi:hypothetical protein